MGNPYCTECKTWTWCEEHKEPYCWHHCKDHDDVKLHAKVDRLISLIAGYKSQDFLLADVTKGSNVMFKKLQAAELQVSAFHTTLFNIRRELEREYGIAITEPKKDSLPHRLWVFASDAIHETNDTRKEMKQFDELLEAARKVPPKERTQAKAYLEKLFPPIKKQ